MRSIEELSLTGRRVLVRVDFNVPLAEGRVTDNTRIEQTLPTIRHARDRGARLILCSHLGRPKGERRAELSLAPVARELGRLLGCAVPMASDCVGAEVEAAVAAMADGDVLVLENLRFHAEEEANDAGFARRLAALAEVYINDGFGTAHRAHASTVGVAELLPERAAGLLMLGELRALGSVLERPAEPLVAVVGGAKVSDKLRLLNALAERASTVLVGGAMAYTLLRARGHTTGSSRVEEDRLSDARALLEDAARKGVSIELPSDHVAASEFKASAEAIAVDGPDIGEGLVGLDIGPRTRASYVAAIGEAATVLWNGPMGVFEWKSFREGTLEIARAVADSPATTVVGGGDSVAALALSGRTADVTHVSTGGGATLELLEGRTLPAIAALEGT